MSDLPPIGDQCRNRWRSILPMFGIDSRYLSGKHGPCPICDGRDRFRFDDKDGKGTFFCNHCGAGDGVQLVMLKTGRPFVGVVRDIRERLGETMQSAQVKARDPAALIRSARAMWEGSVPLTAGDCAGRYLATRGCHGPFAGSLRFCPSARVTDHPTRSTLPALIALVTDPSGAPANVHRTFLDGPAKADIPAPRKMMAGDVPEGSAIRLATHRGVLGVAEGIETALRVMHRFGIPCWSLIDAEKLKRFAIPADVRDLRVFGDHDLNFVGQAATFELARHAATMRGGPDVVAVHIPATPGTDWADEDLTA